MHNEFEVAIVGSGPAGLSAGARAAATGMTHLVLESSDQIANSIVRYQRGKWVMAFPTGLPLRSDLSFEAASRESVLEHWSAHTDALGINIRCRAEVVQVRSENGGFHLIQRDGAVISAHRVILAIGLQGNINKLDLSAHHSAPLQYHLDDPAAYQSQRIVVIGAGDSAIENALGLATHNTVYLANRGGEFPGAKPANEQAILAAIECGDVVPIWHASVIQANETSIQFKTPKGKTVIECDRVIARLGATPPRLFLQACGVTFPSEDSNALPELSPHYETRVPGLFIVGSLAGYPLIKQALNQGYEVIEHLRGNTLAPADEPLLKEKFSALGTFSIASLLDRVAADIPLFGQLNPLVLHDVLAESTLHVLSEGEIVFERNDYTNSLFAIFEGSVAVLVDPDNPSHRVILGQGGFFGEMGLISGRRRSATVIADQRCVLFEVPRRLMLKLCESVHDIKREIDRTAMLREITTHIAPTAEPAALANVVEHASIESYSAGTVLFREGDDGDALYLLRKGSVAICRKIGTREVTLSYARAGHYVGEMALVSQTPRSATVKAVVDCEVVRVSAESFGQLMAENAALRTSVENTFRQRLAANEQILADQQASDVLGFLLSQGVSEATDILVIDETLCTGCNNCEVACAMTHHGVTRLDRQNGPSFANLHLPTSCRHCEHPYCMSDCPPDAISRSADGEVYINDSCIGCGNCQQNCPYGVIQMAKEIPVQRNFLSWLLFGRSQFSDAAQDTPERAVKCDMCSDIDGGPACVRACPTGAAFRTRPEMLMAVRDRPE